MKKISFKAIFVPTISLLIICVIVAFALSFTNAVTKDKIAENEEQNKKDSMLTVCSDAKDFKETDNENVFEAIDDSGNTYAYAISTDANGYGGQVKVMTGIDKDGNILAIDVYYNDDETPGLGKNTSDPDKFTNQFNKDLRSENGKEALNSENEIVVSKDDDGSAKQTIDAVTSATISSRACTKAVNDALKIFNEEVKGVQ